jgi:hypothetical protein
MELAGILLNPFARKRLPQVPSILQVIMLSMVANRRLDLPLSETDVLVRPEIPADLRFTSWERHNEVFLNSYRDLSLWIQNRIAENDPQVRMVIGAAQPPPATARP